MPAVDRLRRPPARPPARPGSWVLSARQEPALALEPNEIKQLITMTAEDVVAGEHRSASACPTRPAGLGPALRLRAAGPRPRAAAHRRGQDPAAGADHSPEWFAPLNVNQQEVVRHRRARLGQARRRLHATGSSGRRGIEPQETRLPGRSNVADRRTTPLDGSVGADRPDRDCAPRSTRAAGGGATTDPTAPAKGPGDKDPNEPAFTVRAGRHRHAPATAAEDRKTLFAYRDDATLHQG